jgi:hypothetical protein
MRGNFCQAGVLTLLIVALNSTIALAGPVLGEDDFCAWAQQEIAGTALEAQVRVHASYDEFVESKPTTNPLQVHQYSSNPLNDGSGINQVISCKMKTAQRLEQSWESAADGVIAEGDTSCDAVHRRMLERLRSGLGAEENNAGARQFVVDEEELTFMGPMWLSPWPFEPVVTDDSGRLHLQSRALYVPFSWWIPMPDRFKGTYYCHLANPVYLEALFREEL